YELISVPLAGEHFRRRPLRHVRELGFSIEEAERFRLGVVERVAARKPAVLCLFPTRPAADGRAAPRDGPAWPAVALLAGQGLAGQGPAGQGPPGPGTTARAPGRGTARSPSRPRTTRPARSLPTTTCPSPSGGAVTNGPEPVPDVPDTGEPVLPLPGLPACRTAPRPPASQRRLKRP